MLKKLQGLTMLWNMPHYAGCGMCDYLWSVDPHMFRQASTGSSIGELVKIALLDLSLSNIK